MVVLEVTYRIIDTFNKETKADGFKNIPEALEWINDHGALYTEYQILQIVRKYEA